MKKSFISILVLVCLLFFVSAALSGEPGEAVKDDSFFKPSLSVGYAFDAGDTQGTFTAMGPGVGGVRRYDSRTEFSGIYIGGELPFAFTERLTLTLAGSWAFSFSDDTDEIYYANFPATVGFRTWDSDSDWVTADLLVSYAFIKNVSRIKDFSVSTGCRWDNYDISGGQVNSQGMASRQTDTFDFDMWTLSPVLGLSTTLEGFKAGIFGGDIKIGAMGGLIVWGDLEYSERFGGVAATQVMYGSLNGEYFWEVLAEFDILSGERASLSIFGKYIDLEAEDDVVGFGRTDAGLIIGTDTFNFEIDREFVVVGLKASIAF